MLRISASVLAASVVLSACGGGGGRGSVVLPPVGTSPPPPAQTSVAVVVRVPSSAPQTQTTRRRPRYVSSATKSLAVTVNGGTPVVANLTPGSPSCTTDTSGTTCTIGVTAPVGTDAFEETLYAGIGASGSALSHAKQPWTIVAGQRNVVTLTLDGVVASVAIALGQNGVAAAVRGTASTIAVSVVAKDASGEAIVGDPYDTPISLTDSDGSGATSLSASSVASPSDDVTLNYSGASIENATISASGVANVTPATLYPKTASTVDWATYGFDAQRSGANASERSLSAANVANLTEIWSYPLDGPYPSAQPLVASNVLVPDPLVPGGGYVDLVLVGDDHGGFHAVDAATGKRIWHVALGATAPGCGDFPDGVFGIVGTAALDRAANRVFVVDGAGKLYAFDLGTGKPAAGWPAGGVSVVGSPQQDAVYSGVQYVASLKRLYVATASICDNPPWSGAIRAIDAGAATPTGTFFPGGSPGNGVGIWGPGGVALDPGSGTLYALTGNDVPDDNQPYSDGIVALSSSLGVLAYDFPGSTPIVDDDFGASPVVYDVNGDRCVAGERKDGTLFVWNRGGLGAPSASVAIGTPTEQGVNLGTPAYAATTQMLYVANASDGPYPHGLLAFAVQGGCTLSAPRWARSFGSASADAPFSPPTVANGVVYVGDGTSNTLHAFDAASGAPLWASSTIGGATFVAPAVANGELFAVAWDGRLHAFAPGGTQSGAAKRRPR